MREKSKRVDFLDGALVALAAGFLLIFGFGFLIFPQERFSEQENRALATWEMPSLSEILDGSFSERLGTVYRDQFPLRSGWISLKAYGEILLGKRENGGILWGEDGMLMARNTDYDRSVAERNLSAVRRFREEDPTRPVTAVWIPQSADVMTRYLPKDYPIDAASALYSDLEGEGVVPLRELTEAAERGTQVYYRTDHHLTTEGAYLVYCALGERLGYLPRSLDFFSRQTVSEHFLGSADSAIGGIAPRADTVELFRYEGDGRVRVFEHTTGEVRDGFYDFDALEQKDQYEVFLGGNFAHLSITSGAESEKPTLLLIKDSFANALIPFLAIHFDLEVLDLRYLSDETEVADCDQTLILQGVHTLATDPSLAKLSFLKKKG